MIKLRQMKQEIYQLTQTINTKQLKTERSDLVQNKDLRYKSHWQEILQQLKFERAQGEDISLKDLEASENMLRKSLIAVGELAGLNESEITVDWQRIKLENQFSDIHIEEL